MKALAQWRAMSKALQLHGWRIASWTIGEDPAKPWLLLLHGFPTSSWDWTRVIPLLQDRFNLAAIDMLGFGLSEKPRRIDYHIALQADLQEAFLESIGVGEAHLLAHDYGVTVAQELLARQNERGLSFSLPSIVFLNGGLIPESHRPRRIQRMALGPMGPTISRMLTKKALRDNFEEIFGPHSQPSDEEIDGHWAMIAEGKGNHIFHKLLLYMSERKLHRDRFVGALSDAARPMRLINGVFDPVSGAHLADAYEALLPQADIVRLEAIGHYPHTEAPKQVADAVLAFHASLAGAPLAEGEP